MIRSSKNFLPYKKIKEQVKKESMKKREWKLPVMIIILLFTICIIIRSSVGFLASYSWKT
jgi:nitrate reductase NapE component